MTHDQDAITLAIDGELDLGLFAAAVDRLKDLTAALSDDLAPNGDVRWRIADLKVGSAVVTLGVESSSDAAVRRVTRGFNDVGAALEGDQRLEFSPRVAKAARRLGELTRQKGVKAVRFQTASRTSTVVKLGPNAKAAVRQRHAWGAVSGRVTSLKKVDALEFTLTDSVFGVAVTCHLRVGQEGEARCAWDTYVTVSGMVERDPGTGRPRSVRQISQIEQLPDRPRGAWRAARGTLPWKPGDPPAEAAIRRVRDDV